MRPVTVVGDALLDRDVVGDVARLAPDAPVPVLDEEATRGRPGGAALAAALLAADGQPVVLVSALGDDPAGRELAGLLDAAGVELVDLGLGGPTPEKIRLCAGDRALLRLDRGGRPSPVGPVDERARRALSGAAAVLVADYGRGVAAAPALHAALRAGVPGRRPIVWDPHPRGGRPVTGATVATPNQRELAVMAGAGGREGGHRSAPIEAGADLAATAAQARRVRDGWQAQALAVTLGQRGALLLDGEGPPLAVPGLPVRARDTCGAGDRFSASVSGALAGGALVSEAVVEAVRAAGSFVAAGAAGAFRPGAPPPVPSAAAPQGRPAMTDPVELARHHRRQGGTVVATGGCFDLLHAGHVATLRAARSLGSCLIVCLNSDESVRRLKGPGRPLVPAADRRAVLLALDCVDAVAVFDEDTPGAVLERLQPHLFAKGGDYAGSHLPEADTLARWGGQAVVLPYLSGRSTSGLVARAAGRGR